MYKDELFSEPSAVFTVCNVNIVHGNLNLNSQVYVQKPQQNCTFMNSASIKEFTGKGP